MEWVGVEGWGGNGHLLEAYSTKPTCSAVATVEAASVKILTGAIIISVIKITIVNCQFNG